MEETNGTNAVKVLALVVVLAVFVLGVDPLIFWLAVPWPGLSFVQVYIIWLAVVALGITIALVRYLTQNQDSSHPTTRKTGRII